MYTMKDYFSRRGKDELVNIARQFGVKKYSRLKKDALIDKIIEFYCSQEGLSEILSSFEDQEMATFKHLLNNTKITVKDVPTCFKLKRHYFGMFLDNSQFVIFDEVKRAIHFINNTDFNELRIKKVWLMKCLHFVSWNYGIAPIEVVYQLYCLKHKGEVLDMLDMLVQYPLLDMIDDVNSLPSAKKLGYPIHTDYGYIQYYPEYYKEHPDMLIQEQADKPFYIPTIQEIEALYDSNYPANNSAYKRLKQQLIATFKINETKAKEFLQKFYEMTVEDISFSEMTQLLVKEGLEFDNIHQANNFMPYLVDAWNNSPLIINRGYTPQKLHELFAPKKRPTIVPGSSHAASMLAAMQNHLQGVDIDPNINASTINQHGKKKKIYPNDTCPCGSGKKYKKCCRLKGK